MSDSDIYRTTGPGAVSRRGFLKLGAAGAVASVGGSAWGLGTAGAQTLEEAFGDTIEHHPPVWLGMMAYEEAKKYLGDERDYSEYTGADALHTEILAGATRMESADERVMTGIENNITNSQNVALAKGKAAIIEEMNAENGETAANDAMSAAINDYYAVIQENILTHYKSQLGQVRHHYDQVDGHDNLTPGDVFVVWDPDDGSWMGSEMSQYGNYWDTSNANWSTETVDLLNGDTVEGVEVYDNESTNTRVVTPDYSLVSISDYETDGGEFYPGVVDPDGTDSNTEYMQPARFADAMARAKAERDDVAAQLSGFVSDVYAEYEPGEIPTEDLVDPITASTELSQDYDHYSTQAAHAAMLGIPTTAEESLVLEVWPGGDESEARLVDADIYTEYVPTDGEGNEVGFQADDSTVYEPANWDKPLYIAYEATETNEDGEVTDRYHDFVQLEDPFKVVSAYDRDGNEVDSFQTESRNTQTADVSTLEEELAQIRETQLQMQEDAEEETSPGGAGGFLDDLGGGTGMLLLVLAGGAAALHLGGDN